MNREVRLGLLTFLLLLAFAGFRGDTKRESRGDYVNDIRATSNGVYRFARDSQGNTATPSLSRSVTFLDIYNGTAAEVTLTLFTRSAPGAADTVLVYVPAGGSRSFPGVDDVDSVRVSATFGGDAVILGGMD